MPPYGGFFLPYMLMKVNGFGGVSGLSIFVIT
jgi:hypothetical protein